MNIILYSTKSIVHKHSFQISIHFYLLHQSNLLILIITDFYFFSYLYLIPDYKYEEFSPRHSLYRRASMAPWFCFPIFAFIKTIFYAIRSVFQTVQIFRFSLLFLRRATTAAPAANINPASGMIGDTPLSPV